MSESARIFEGSAPAALKGHPLVQLTLVRFREFAREPDLPGLWRGCGIEDVHELRPSFGAAVILWGTRAR